MDSGGIVGEARKGVERSPGLTYQEILDLDTRPVPDVLREQVVPDLGTAPVPISRYTDPEFFRKEIDKVWLRVWQFACREEDIPNPGDFTTYDVVGKSLLIVRQKDGSIRAFANSCLHRGRKLATSGGCKEKFRCMYHGWTWNADGTFAENPMPWDFPQAQADQLKLPEVLVDTWGGFVFINFDRNAPSLASVLNPMPRHFERWRLEDCYKAMHVAKVIPANWKAVSEAFMESHHSLTTHPQILPYLADENSQYDILSEHITRHISASGVPSPFLDESTVSQNDIIAAMFATSGRTTGEGELKVPPGMTARAFAAEIFRKTLSDEDGHDYSDKSDAEMLDPILYNCFPNMSFWAGFAPNLVYRWRPVGLSHEHTLMEVIRLKRIPKTGPRPRPVPMHMLSDQESWRDAPELGPLADIFEQDMANLPFVQDGMNASLSGVVHFGRYSEMRIRQHHLLLEKYMSRD
ncbi:MAG: aromatic ring-hydroxylating dioxygenase subunit alpha [Alphaproteobacteria bacterium]|nr:aromatic ring-hydroxylating dioxygenase subunit alpha [Alphaproteobacteria bacterium]